MIVSSIDIIGGKAVQLEQGERLVIERDDIFALAERFGRCGEIAVIDIDAARGTGENRALIEQLCGRARCRVGGGIRDVETAKRYLRAGAQRLIIGTAATPALLRALPRERTIVAIDARDGTVATHGWRRRTDETPLARATALEPYCSGFLFTQIEREGMLGGLGLAFARELRAQVGGTLTVAGGVKSVEEIAALDRDGIDVQAGMALYTGLIDPIEVIIALTDFTKAGNLVPTVVCDARDGTARMLAYSSPASLRVALRDGTGTYFSRSRDALWRKGETSGAMQRLVRIELDCDRDAVRFFVDQTGPTCHTGAETCFGASDFTWEELRARVAARAATGDIRSYTRRLLDEPKLLAEKIAEEAREVVAARTRDEVAWECADVLYFLTVRMQAAGVSIRDVMAHLASRAV